MKYNVVDATDASKRAKGPTPPIASMTYRGAEVLLFERFADAVAYPLRRERGVRFTQHHIQEERSK